ncbi:MAG TPA: oligosaccharide flippase family protein [Acetobacteraceae bacterium]|nr:oligosaccharide flippase family protein [Acetobacteraceae bacterium]
MSSLLQKTVGGAGWTIGWRAVTRALGFLSTLVLARLLVPADFGLVALAMSFARGIDILADLGVQDALIRITAPTRDAYDTAFTVNAIRGLVTATAIGISAWPFAQILGDPRLFQVVLALAAAVALDSFVNVGVADFRRDFAFHREFQLHIFPRIAQVIVTIGLAVNWASYWALVCGIVTERVLSVVASYAMHPYRPHISLAAWREIVSFSTWTWLVGMARMVRERGTVMIIGGLLNATQVGIFAVGAEVATLPESELIGPLSRACFPSFAAARRAGTDVAENYLRIIASTLVIATPASIGISSIAAPLVILAFGSKWQPATPIVAILGASGTFAAITRISTVLLSACNILRPVFWNVVTVSVLQFALLVVFTRQWGIVGAAYAAALALLLEQIGLSVRAFRRFGMRPGNLMPRIWRGLTASAAMAACLALSGFGWRPAEGPFTRDLTQLLVTISFGAAVYTGILLALWLLSGKPDGPEADVLELVRRTFGRLRGLRGQGAAIL